VLNLRYPWLWVTLGWFLVLGVCVGSLVPGDRLPTVSISDKLVHAGSYFLLMIWFAGLYGRKHHTWIALVLVLLGIALDVAQTGTETRSFELRDILANFLGVLLGLGLSLWLLAGWCQRLEQRLLASG
jgi:VanZ family protein